MRQVRLGDLDVVPEDRVIAHLQRPDSRTLHARAPRWPRSPGGPSWRRCEVRRVPHRHRLQWRRHPQASAEARPRASVAMRAVTSSSVSRRLARSRQRSRSHGLQRGFQGGQTRRLAANARTSRGPAESRRDAGEEAFEVEDAAKGAADLFALDEVSRALRLRPHSGIRWSDASISGRRIVARNRRLPMGV